jgi:uncharacterized repeat protein (TIGR02059 family)/LPXTG-motif cell wall-anchored protein
MTTSRGRHRKLRRNILHTVIATALLAGTFTVVDQTVNSPTASATANGSDDTAFNTAIASSLPSASVNDTAIDLDGNVYVAYDTFVRKYNSSGGVVWTSPAHPANRSTDVIAVDSSGQVVVGTVQGLWQLTAAGAWNTTTFAAASGTTGNPSNQGVYAVAIQNTNPQKIIVAATTMNGSKYLTRLSLAGAFEADLTSNSTFINGIVRDIAVDAANNIYVAGEFAGRVKRINADYTTTGAAATFNTNSSAIFTGNATNIAVSNSGLVAVGGPNTGVGRLRVLSSAGNQDTSFGSSLSSVVPNDLANGLSDVAFDTSGRLLVGGSFGLRLINTDGSQVTAFTPTTNGTVRTIAVQVDEEIVVGMSSTPFVKRINPVWGMPSTPPTPTAVAGDRSATVSVAAGTGVLPKSILITASPGGATCTITGASGSCVVSGLTNGTAYTFTAVSTNEDKTSATSAASAAVTPIDTIKPVLISASSAGAIITLTFNEPISSTTAPIGQFAVALTPADATNTRSSVSVSGNTVQITMSKVIPTTTSVAVTYTSPTQVNTNPPANAAIQDLVGNDVNTFTAPTFFAGDITAPVLASSAVGITGRDIALTFTDANNLLANTSLIPTASAFSVDVNGTVITPTQVSITANTKIVNLTLGMTIDSNDVVKVSYTAPSDSIDVTNVAIQDTSGNDAASFSDSAATNNSSVPALVSINVSTTAGTTVVLTYNEPLSATTAPGSAFTVTSGGRTTTATNAVVSGSTVTLTLPTGVEGSGTVVVNYTAPAVVSPPTGSATTNLAVQDSLGYDATSLPAPTSPVTPTNSSTVDTLPPVFVSGFVAANGTDLVLTFNENLMNAGSFRSDAWVVEVNGTNLSTQYGNSTLSGPVITIPLNTTISTGQVVRVKYVKQNNTTDIADLGDRRLVNFGPVAVANNSEIDRLAPVLQSIEVPAGGDRLILKYNEAMGATLPAVNTSNFGVTVGGVAWLPTSISVDGNNVILTGPATIEISKTVVLTKYTAPAANIITTNAAIQDTSGNDAVSLSNVTVTNNSTLDITGPTVSSVASNADGTQVTLTFNEPLSEANPPLASQFSVANTGGYATTVSGVSVSGSTVVLTLSSPLGAGAGKTVSYTASSPVDQTTGNGAIQDVAGNDSLAISNRPITNSSTVDQTPPAISSITSNAAGTEVTLTFNEPLSESNPPLASQFSVTNTGGYATTVSSVSVSGSTVVLTLSSPLGAGAGKTVSYTASSPVDPTTGNGAIQDITGNDSLAITNSAIANSSTVDQTPPTVSSVTTNTAGTQVTLTFNEPLSETNPPLASQFSVANTGGYATTVSGVSVTGSTVVLTLSSPLGAGAGKTVSYTASSPVDPTTGNGAIQDVAGNDSLTITNSSITNSSTVDQTGPVLIASSPIKASQDVVTISFDEALQSSPSAPASAFSVTVGATSYPVSAVSVNGKVVELSLSVAIPAGATVRVVYTAPQTSALTSNSALQDTTGNDALSFDRTLAPYTSTWGWTPTSTKTSGAAPCQSQSHNNGGPYTNAAVTAPVWLNSAKTTALSNGVNYSVGVSGPSVCIGDYPEAINYWYGLPSQFIQTRSLTDPGVSLTTSHIGCANAPVNTVSICANRGIVTIEFDRPVTNPVIAMSGMGGWHSNGSLSWSEFSLLTPNVTLSSVSGTNLKVTNGNYIEPITKRPWMNCDSASGSTSTWSAVTNSVTATAMCGTVRANGTMTSLSFQVNLGLYGGQNGGNAWYDQFAFVVTTTEDFGLAPATYDAAGVASHALDNLKLGASVEADQTTADKAAVSPDAVASGTSLANHPKADDGVSAWGSSPSVALVPGASYSITAALAGVASSANLCGWIDFNRNGTFDSGERACATSPNANDTSATLNWTVPNIVTPGLTYARLRLSYDAVSLPTGKVSSGEVEDYSLTILGPPMTAKPDVTSGLKGATQTINLLTNTNGADIPSQGATLVASSVRLCDVTETSPNCTKTSVTVAGVGTYSVANGVMTFVPDANYSGTPAAMPYIVTDSSGGTGASTYTPTVYGTPTASPDVKTDEWDTNQTFTPASNDTAGSGTTLVANSVKLCGISPVETPNNCTKTSLVVAGQGTYTVNADGTVTFDPLPTFTGTATPVKYVVADSLGQKTNSTITPTVRVPAAPTALPNPKSDAYDTNQTINTISDDTANPNFPLLANSVKLCGINPVETPNNCTKNSLEVPGEGTYTVNPDGTVTFNPLPTFTGTATPVTYQAKDSLDRFVSESITPTVGLPPTPTASPDSKSGNYDVDQVISPLGNDSANSNFPLDPTSVKLCGINPVETPNNCTKTSLEVPGEGTYTVNPDGTVTFNPLPTFTGPATPIKYQAKDEFDRFVDSTITTTVGPPPAPAASPDTASGNYDVDQVISPLGNDSANSNFPLDPTSVKLCGINPVETPNNCTKTSLEIPGEGTYTVNPDGTVTFNPLPTFTGPATPIKYQVSDSEGRIVNSTIATSVGAPPAPTASPNISSGAMDAIQFIDPLANDVAGNSSFPLDPTSVKLCGINPVETPNNCTKTTLEIPGKGTFTVDPVTGIVKFVPVTGYSGPVPAIDYVVADSRGVKTSSTITVIVAPQPAMSATTDTSSGDWNTPQTIDPLGNDSPGETDGIPNYNTIGTVEINDATVRFCGTDDPATPGNEAQVPNNCDKTSVTTAAGTYTVNTTTGEVTFTPVKAFTGTEPNPPTYQVCNSITGTWDPVPAGTCASAQIVPTVGAPPVPSASANTSSGDYDTNQVITPLDNDNPGSAEFPIVASTVKLCGAGQTPSGCDKTTLEVFGEGTYTVNPDGTVTFNPLPTFTGTATPIKYQVKDSLDRVVDSTITATVGPPPPAVANPDVSSKSFDTLQTISPLGNDTAGNSSFPIDPTSLKLCGPDDVSTNGIDESVPPNCVATTLEVPNVGTYTVKPNGTVEFDPLPTFTGVAPAVKYQVEDSEDRVVNSTITATVGPPPVAAANDTNTDEWDVNQVINPLANDTVNENWPFDPTTVKLCGLDPVQTPNACDKVSLTVPGEGTYTVNADGTVTFDPLPTFTGTVKTPVTYQVTDDLDRTVNAKITPSVTKPPLPTARPDVSSGNKDVNQVVNLVTNPDVAGADESGATGLNLDPSTVRLCAISPAQTPPNCTATTLTVAGVGTYTVDASGQMTFDPLPTYTGTPAPVKYIVKDETGQVANSTYTPTVFAPPTVRPDTSVGPQNTVQTRNVITNAVNTGDAANSGATLDLKTLAIECPNPSAVTCTVGPDGEIIMAGQGTYTIDPANPGFLIFTPEPEFTGTAVGVKYSITDSNGQTSSTTYTPAIVSAPTANPDVSTGAWNTPQSINVVNNASGNAGDDSVAAGYTLDPASVVLSCPTSPVNPDCSTATVNGKITVTIAGQGTYSIDPVTPGKVIFTPVLGFKGTADPVTYTVSDNLGQTDSTTYTPTVTPPTAIPTVAPDTSTGPWNTPQSRNVLTNDSATTRSALDPDSASLSCTSATTPACIVNGDGTVTITGQGTYSLDPNNPGVVIFTPLPTFTGTARPVKYTVEDVYGLAASTTYTPTVSKPPAPVARPDTTTGNKDVNQVVNLVTNPSASGADSAGVAGLNLDPSTVRLCTISPAQTPPNCTATTLTVAGVGTYTVDATGQMTFDPLPTFTGTPAPVKYIVKDETGQVANSTYTPTVLAPPTVKPDTSVGPANTAQTRNVITNTVNTSDTANSGATLDLTSLAIACPSVPATPSAIAPGLAAVAKPAAVTCTVGPNGEVIMAGQGTYTIDPAKPGFLIFTPEPTFTGTATGVSYSITDSNGQVSSTTYTPTVIPAPTARDDYSVAEQGATQWISPVGNDTSSDSAKLVPGTVLLCRAGEPPPDCEATEVVIPGQGTFTVSAYGVVKFVPEPGFTGTVTPLNYQVADSLGQKTDATIFVEVLPPPAPSATMDTGSADYNKPVTLSPWLNDFAGTKPDGSESNLAAPALVPTSIRLCTTVQTPPNCNATRVTTVDGTYVVDTKTGKVVFTPVNGFTGTVTAPVTYQISNNWSGFAGPGVATSILVPTINPPGAPAATVDVTTTKPGVSVVIVPVGNDKPGSSPLNPKTIRLCGANEISPSCTQTSVTTLDGTYVVDTKTGHVTFTPRSGFTGKATIPYVITDTLGKKANSNLIITVKDSAQSPVVKPVVDKPELPKTGGTRPDLLLLLGLVAIAGAGGLRFAGRRK